jgi:hypothetical protein
MAHLLLSVPPIVELDSAKFGSDFTLPAYSASANIFAANVVIPADGICIISAIPDSPGRLDIEYNDATDTWTGELNDGSTIGSDVISEFEFTVRAGDRINAQYSTTNSVRLVVRLFFRQRGG